MPAPDLPPDLLAELYDDLRRRAGRLVVRGGEVAPSSLVQETLERLYRTDAERWTDFAHFKATAARAMRQILLDRVKAAGRLKRGGGEHRVPMESVTQGVGFDPVDLLALHEALEALEAARPRCAEIARLRLLGDLEIDEIAAVLEISPSTVKREWRAGRAFVMAGLAVGTQGSTDG